MISNYSYIQPKKDHTLSHEIEDLTNNKSIEIKITDVKVAEEINLVDFITSNKYQCFRDFHS